MPTYWSKTLIPTLREAPADATVPSHRLMLRAGMIRQLGAGHYSYLPLGLRALQKVMAVVRREMDAAGAVEVFMPTLQPIELWEQTGRRADYGDNLFVLTDRHGREVALGPTHEEVTTDLVKNFVDSYKQLPLTVYQIQTKFRDEYRPRFGVLRSREFQMKDAYSFDIDVEGLDKSYQAMYDAYCRIFESCGVPYEIVEAESGPIGGSASHEFMVPSPTGEDTILKSDKGNYAANVEKCETGDRPTHPAFAPFSRAPKGSAPASHGGAKARSDEASASMDPTGDLEKVHTPHCATIEDVCDFFKKKVGSKLKPQSMLKSMLYVATRDSDASDPTEAKDPWYVLAIVRGDHEVNLAKLRDQMDKAFGEDAQLQPAPEQLARDDKWALGFIGPHAAPTRDDTYLLVDPDAAQGGFWVAGANEADHHVKHFNWQRDVLDSISDDAKQRLIVADIRNAVAGDPSPKGDGGVLEETKGIEVGHVFKLGCKYTDALDLKVLDDSNERRSVIMGCYGIGTNRILAGAIERPEGNDDNGIIWPAAIAPYQVIITPIKFADQVKDAACDLARDLEAQGIDVLIDDREERPGVKFKDADLIGIPVRVVVGDKGLKDGNVEIKPRSASDAEMVSVDQAATRIAELLKTL